MPSSASRELSVLFSVFLILSLCLGCDQVDLRFFFYHCRCSLVDCDPTDAHSPVGFTLCAFGVIAILLFIDSALELLLSLVYDINNSSTILLDLLSVQRNLGLNSSLLSSSILSVALTQIQTQHEGRFGHSRFSFRRGPGHWLGECP
jgi:hypothetical protein